jgi:hypothetical protein
MTNQLALYESARAALAKAVKVDEVKEIRDKAMAIKAAAKIAKDREMEANAYELRARAERRLGEMMEAGKADRASQGGDRKSKDSAKLLKPTLKEAGIDGNLAHRARSAAAMSDEDFAAYVETHRDSILQPVFQPAYPESKEQKAERLAERRERKKQREREMAETYDGEEEEQRAAEPVAEIITPKRGGTQSAAPEIISPNFTAKGAVNQTRFAEAMRDVKRRLRSAYALSNRATFFKHARDMLDELEREFTAELARSA